MHQSLPLKPAKRRVEVDRVANHVAAAVDAAKSDSSPFLHLVLAGVFPEDIYAEMTARMPEYDEYRPMGGRSKRANEQGNSTRVKIDLFPEFVRYLPEQKQRVWDIVGRALTSSTVREAFVRKLASALERRFGAGYANTGFSPIPILTRDIPGYKIKPHTDTHWKGITVQLYLPRDSSTSHIGTIFHQRQLDTGKLKRTVQMQFVPNSGYAFAVGDDTWHSADPVGTEVTTRDSILLTYFVDSGPMRVIRNRGKRVVNFFVNEFRQRTS